MLFSSFCFATFWYKFFAPRKTAAFESIETTLTIWKSERT